MAPGTEAEHSYTVTEPERTPLAGLLFGSAAMVPLAAGAGAAWLAAPGSASAALIVALTSTWAGAIVAFLAGVRRGLSFRAPDGATAPQLVTMLWLFLLAFAALALGPGRLATAILIAGYVSLAVFDTMAARREEAPPYFARLRPAQMAVAVVSLTVLLARQMV